MTLVKSELSLDRRCENPEENAVHQSEWSAHSNIGFSRDEDSAGERTDLRSYSVAGSVKLSAVADLGAQMNAARASNTDPAGSLAGFIFTPSDKVALGLGLKLGLNSAEADHSVRGGITFRL